MEVPVAWLGGWSELSGAPAPLVLVPGPAIQESGGPELDGLGRSLLGHPQRGLPASG